MQIHEYLNAIKNNLPKDFIAETDILNCSNLKILFEILYSVSNYMNKIEEFINKAMYIYAIDDKNDCLSLLEKFDQIKYFLNFVGLICRDEACRVSSHPNGSLCEIII